MLSDNGDPEFDVLALVPEWLRPNWEETVKQVMEDWNSWGDPVDPPPELLAYRKFIDQDEERVEIAPRRVEPLAVDIREAARLLGCGRTLIYELISSGQLCAVKIGRLTRIPMAGLRRLVEPKSAEGETGSWPDKPGWWEKIDWGVDAER